MTPDEIAEKIKQVNKPGFYLQNEHSLLVELTLAIWEVAHQIAMKIEWDG